jgi:hypothetical protein
VAITSLAKLSFIPNPFESMMSSPLKEDEKLMYEVYDNNPPPQKFIDFNDGTYLITDNTGVQVAIFLAAVIMYLLAKGFSFFKVYLKVTEKIVHMLEWNPLLMLLSSQFMELVVYSSLNLRYVSLLTFNNMTLFFNYSVSFVVLVIATGALVSVF